MRGRSTRQRKTRQSRKSRKHGGLTAFGPVLNLPPMRRGIPAGPVLFLLLAACGDPNELPPATQPSFVDTLDLWALSGTPVWQPSAFLVAENRTARLDQTTVPDIGFEIRPDGQAVLMPAVLMGSPGSGGINPGLQRTTTPFDSIDLAATENYTTLDTVHVAPGDVFYIRGRLIQSCFTGTPIYGKLEAIEIDDIERTLTFRVLVNRNCGYKSLETGLPNR